MIPIQQSDCRPRGTEFPDDFPQRLERLRAASGLTWRRLARELGVGVRSLYRWRAGTRPDAALMLAIVEFATEQELLDYLLSGTDESKADERQARLFGEDVWAWLCGGGAASEETQETRRAA
ncbi:MAG: helix-turn-helix transcriptional regulator [Acidimicrobiia bacterium]|nr:helix-turn-helix transcriptional regulator [Acidimicrobiia bacterium]